MSDREHLLHALARAAAPGPGPRVPALERLCRAAVALLGADGGAVTGTLDEPIAVATDALAARLADLEQVAGDGPGVQAMRTGRGVAALVGGVPRQRGGSGSRDLGVLGASGALPEPDLVVVVRAWPVRAGGRTVGVLRAHGAVPPAAAAPTTPTTPRVPGTPRTPGMPRAAGVPVPLSPPWTAPPEAGPEGQVLADALAPALLAHVPDGLTHEIHRAVGMVVAQTGLPARDAHALLRARAWADGTRLADTAAAVLARRLMLSRPGAEDAG